MRISIPLPEAELRSTSRIPSTSQSGVVAIGQALRGVGQAISGTATDIRRHQAQVARVEQQRAEFDAQVELQQFETQISNTASTAALSGSVDGSGQELAAVDYIQQYTAGINARVASLRENGQDMVATKLQARANAVVERQLAVVRNNELKGRRTYEGENIKRSADKMETEVGLNPDVNDTLLQEQFELIDNSVGYTPQEKEFQKLEVQKLMKAREVAVVGGGNPTVTRELVGGPRTVRQQTNLLLQEHEGLRNEAYWDRDHWRVGFASDTVTLPDGTFRPTRKGDVITDEEAIRDRDRRVDGYEKDQRRALGDEAWSRLPSRASAVLNSIIHNYGKVPKRIIPAFRSSDITQMAAAVRSLQNDRPYKKGGIPVNQQRRLKEATYLETGKTGTASVIAPGSPRYAELTQLQRDSLYADAIIVDSKNQRALATLQKEEYSALKGGVAKGIEVGTITEPEQIFTSGLNAGDQAIMLSALRTARKRSAAQESQLGAYLAETRMDISSKAARDAGQAIFSQFHPPESWGNGDFGRRQAAAGLVSDELTDAALTARDGSNAVALAKALPEIAEAYKRAPRLFSGDSQEAADMAVEFDDLAGTIGAQRAAETIAKWSDPENRQIREAYAKSPEYKKFVDKYSGVEGMDTAGVLDADDFNIMQAGALARPWNALIEQKRLDMPRAKDKVVIAQARKEFEVRFGPTTVSGDGGFTSMLYPPQNQRGAAPLYQGSQRSKLGFGPLKPVLGFDWIRQDVEAHVEDITGGEDYDKGSWWLEPSPATAGAVSRGDPVIPYDVWWQDERGVSHTSNETYNLDLRPETMQKRQEAAQRWLHADMAEAIKEGLSEGSDSGFEREPLIGSSDRKFLFGVLPPIPDNPLASKRSNTSATPAPPDDTDNRERSLDQFLEGPPKLPDRSGNAPAQ